MISVARCERADLMEWRICIKFCFHLEHPASESCDILKKASHDVAHQLFMYFRISAL